MNVFKCIKCKYETQFRSQFRRHELVHFKIEEVKAKAKYLIGLKKYPERLKINRNTSGRCLKCSKCKFVTKLKENLRKHELKHLKTKHYEFEDDCQPLLNKRKRSIELNKTQEIAEGNNIVPEIIVRNKMKNSKYKYIIKSKELIENHELKKHSKSKVGSSLNQNCTSNLSNTIDDKKVLKKSNHSLKCSQCKFVAKSKGYLKRHELSKRHLICKLKGAKLWKIPRNSDHIKKNKNGIQNEDLKCIDCKYVAKSGGYLRRHLQTKHSKSIEARNVIQEQVEDIENKENKNSSHPLWSRSNFIHEKVDKAKSENKILRCNECKFETKSIAALKRHGLKNHLQSEALNLRVNVEEEENHYGALKDSKFKVESNSKPVCKPHKYMRNPLCALSSSNLEFLGESSGLIPSEGLRPETINNKYTKNKFDIFNSVENIKSSSSDTLHTTKVIIKVNLFKCQKCPFQANSEGLLKLHIIGKHPSFSILDSTNKKINKRRIAKNDKGRNREMFVSNSKELAMTNEYETKNNLHKFHSTNMVEIQKSKNSPEGVRIAECKSLKQNHSAETSNYFKPLKGTSELSKSKSKEITLKTECKKSKLKSLTISNFGRVIKTKNPFGNIREHEIKTCVPLSLNNKKSDFFTNDFKQQQKSKKVKDFRCPVCSYKTKKKYLLKGHALIHQKIKKLSCPECPYKTNLRRNLAQHQWIHLKVQRFKCAKCNYRTNYSSSIKTHELSRHKMS